jgi:ABC-type multidrug transport system ATPase subunit
MLEMKNVSKKVGRSLHIGDVSMTLEKGSVNILLGTDAVRQDLADAADGRA